MSRPQERFPSYFGGSFWKTYPYFLPCLVTSSFVLFAFLITLFFFKEVCPSSVPSLRKGWSYVPVFQTISKRNFDERLLIENDMTQNCPRDDPVPLCELLRAYPVILSVSNYVVLAFLGIALDALLPLFLAMPLHIGGLDFDPSSIGYILGAYGTVGGIFHAFYFARIVKYFGERKIFIYALSLFMPVFLSFPLISATALRFGNQSGQVWFLIAIRLVMMAFSDMAYGM